MCVRVHVGTNTVHVLVCVLFVRKVPLLEMRTPLGSNSVHFKVPQEITMTSLFTFDPRILLDLLPS